MREGDKRLENLKPFQKGQCGNPKGRPKSRVPDTLARVFKSKAAAKRFSALRGFEVDEWEAAVLAMGFEELKTLAKMEGVPSYVKSLAIAMLTDMKDGKTATVDKLRERQYGKPRQLDITTGGSPLNAPAEISREEAARIIKELEEGL